MIVLFIRLTFLQQLHGDYDHMGDSIYLVNNFKIDNIYINSNKLNYLENKLIKASSLKKYQLKNYIKVI